MKEIFFVDNGERNVVFGQWNSSRCLFGPIGLGKKDRSRCTQLRDYPFKVLWLYQMKFESTLVYLSEP